MYFAWHPVQALRNASVPAAVVGKQYLSIRDCYRLISIALGKSSDHLHPFNKPNYGYSTMYILKMPYKYHQSAVLIVA